MDLKDVLSPTLLGPLSYSAGYVPNGVHCFGLAIDEAGIMIAGIFGARPMRMENFHVEISTGVRQGVQLSAEQFIPFRSAGMHNYQLFDYTHKDGLGDLLLVLHRAACLGETLEVIGDEAHFYAFGTARRASDEQVYPLQAVPEFGLDVGQGDDQSITAQMPETRQGRTRSIATQQPDVRQSRTYRAATPRPDLGLWAQRMQDVLALPMLSDWHPVLWDTLVESGFAVPCHNYGGFGPLWEIAISHEEWHDLFLGLVRSKELPDPGKA